MRHLFLPALLSLSFHVHGQANEAKARLTEYGITNDLLIHSFNGTDNRYAHTVTETETNSSGGDAPRTTVRVSTFDPTQAGEAQWVLKSVNGNPPSQEETASFNRMHRDDGKEPEQMTTEVRDEDWKIVSDDDRELVIGFRYEKQDLPKHFRFLADCDGLVFIDKQQKRLTKMRFKNFQETHMSVVKISRLEMEITFHLQEATNEYLIDRSTTDMDMQALGQSSSSKMITEYSGYQVP